MKGEGRGGEGGEKELPFVHFVLCSNQGNEIEGFFLNRVCMLGRILGHFGPKQGRGLKPRPAAQSYPNFGLVPPSPSQLGLQLHRVWFLSWGSFEDAMPGSVSCYKQKQPHITIHEVPTKQNGRRVGFPEKVTQKRNVSHNVLFRAGVCLYSRCGQSYFNIKWRSNNWRRERQRKYRWVKLFVNDTLFLIGCIIKVTLRSVVSLISYGPMELKYNNYLNTSNCICKMLVCVNEKSCLTTVKRKRRTQANFVRPLCPMTN